MVILRLFSQATLTSAIIHLRRVMLEVMYSMIGSLFSLIVHPPADRSAEASDSSKACSQVRSGRPSISSTRPLNTFFFVFFSRVRSPA